MTNLRDLNLPCRLGCNYCTCQATNQEINEAVARKLGWRIEHGLGVMGVGTLIWKPDGTQSMFDPPKYSTSIEAAWEIVESTNESQGYWMIHEDDEPRWTADIIDTPDGKIIRGEADTAPLAICKAFLKLP